jgi:AP-4 complex subunit epsilon-1
MLKGLCDKEPSVMFAALNMYHRAVRADPFRYKDVTSNLIIILKQIVDHKLSKDFDFHMSPSPWMQIKLLKILSMLGRDDLNSSQHIYEVLVLTLSRALDSASNIALAITFQAISTAAAIYPD